MGNSTPACGPAANVVPSGAVGSRLNLLEGAKGARVPARTSYVERLASPSVTARIEAAQGIARLVLRGDVPREEGQAILTAHAADPAFPVQLAVAVALAQIDPVAHAPRLASRLVASLAQTVEQRRLVAAARVFLAMADEDLVARVREAAEATARSGTAQAEGAAWLLGELAAHGDGSAIRPLVALLSDPRVALRAAAAWGLGRSSRPEAFDAMLAILRSNSGAVFEKGLRGLADADTRESVDRLIDVLRFEAPRVVARLRRIPRRVRTRSGEHRLERPEGLE